MNSLKPFSRSLQSLLGSDRHAEIPAFLGNLSGTVPADDAGNVYVTLVNGEVLTVYNGKVPNQSRLPVVVGYGGGNRLQVLRSRDVYVTPPYPDVPGHASLHTFPGPDTVPVRGEQIVPGLVVPAGSLTVKVYSLAYELSDGWHILPTQDVDLTANVPVSGAIFALLEADNTGAIVVTEGAGVDTRAMLEYSDIPAATADHYPVAAVKLYLGQSAILQTVVDSDIIDLRWGRRALEWWAIRYRDTKANIEALTGLVGGEVAYATDTGEEGHYDAVGAAWDWGTTFDLAANIHSAVSDSLFHDDDEFPKSDSQDSWGLKNFTWANVKTALNALYAALTHSHAASDITNGTMATARLGSGTANGTTFLSGDQTYKQPNVPYASSNDIFRCDSPGGDSSFVGTIATLPGGSTLTYNVGSGNEGAMVPSSTSHLGKMRLYNTTRGTNALISNCVTGTSTLTLTATVPAGWQVGDTITIASQTVSGDFKWVDIELTDATLLNKSAISVLFTHIASTAGYKSLVHPTETMAEAKRVPNTTQASGIQHEVTIPILKINSNLFSLAWNGSPTAVVLRVLGYIQ